MEQTTPGLTSNMSAGEELLQGLLLEYGNWERPEGWGPEDHQSAAVADADVSAGKGWLESEDNNDMPVTVDDTEEEDQVDDLA